MTWNIRNQEADELIPDERETTTVYYTLQELHNAVWFPPKDGKEYSGEWFRLADGRKALLMSIDLDFIEDGSMMLKTEEE